MTLTGFGRTFFKILLTAVGYLALAQVGRLLAIPPGFSSPLWPAAGFAFTSVLLWGRSCIFGVWLGHAATNMLIAWDATQGLLEASHTLASMVLGVGGALQAWAGSFLVVKARSWPGPLDRLRDLLVFMALCGPLACILSPLVGVSVLHLQGLIATEDLPWNLWTWWVGDTLGVLFTTPILLTLLASPREDWAGRRRHVVLPMLGLFFACLAMFSYSSRNESQDMDAFLRGKFQTVQYRLEESLNNSLNTLLSIQSFFASSKVIDRMEFASFTRPLMRAHRGLSAVQWCPRIPSALKSHVETEAVAEGLENYVIHERDADNKPIPVLAREEYFPIYFMEPQIENASVLGYDAASEVKRRHTLERVRDSGRPHSSPPLRLIQDPEGVMGVVVYIPIYTNQKPVESVAQRREHLQGFVMGILRINPLLKDILAKPDVKAVGFDLELQDGNVCIKTREDSQDDPHLDSLSITGMIPFAGRNWCLRLRPKASFLTSERTFGAWSMAVGGLSIASLFGIFLLYVTGQSRRLERTVIERTADLAEATLVAQNASRAKDEFLSNMSHELRTPLNSIVGLSEVLMDSELTPEQKSRLSIVLRSGRHLSELIGDILDISKIESGTLNITSQSVALETLVQESADVVRSQALGKGLAFETILDKDLPSHVMLDPVHVRQVLVNLLGNAVKFTDKGFVTLRVLPADKGQHMEFHVEDTGQGILQEDLPLLFHRFTQIDASKTKRHMGTGLGLAISRNLAHLMGGQVRVASEPGCGSTFTLSIPLVPSKAPDPQLQAALGAAKTPVRILVAEDNDDNRILIEAFLQGEGHQLDFAQDGAEALRKATRETYDLVLMDVQMPVLDGLTAVRQLRQYEASQHRPRTPVVALTAHATSAHREEALAAGCESHLTKPLSRDQLLSTIASHAGGRGAAGAPDRSHLPEELVERFLDNRRRELPGILKSCADGNFPELAHRGHDLKGLGSAYGFPEISRIGRGLEAAAKASDGPAAIALSKELEKILG